MSFKARKPFLKKFAQSHLEEMKKEQEPVEEAEAPEEEAKAMETEADAAAEQPTEEAEAGEPAAGGAIAAPVEDAAVEPAAEVKRRSSNGVDKINQLLSTDCTLLSSYICYGYGSYLVIAAFPHSIFMQCDSLCICGAGCRCQGGQGGRDA